MAGGMSIQTRGYGFRESASISQGQAQRPSLASAGIIAGLRSVALVITGSVVVPTVLVFSPFLSLLIQVLSLTRSLAGKMFMLPARDFSSVNSLPARDYKLMIRSPHSLSWVAG